MSDVLQGQAQSESDRVRWEATRDREFAAYYKHRDDLRKGKDEGEKSFDNALMTISTVAIGATFTLLKDFTTEASAEWMGWSWVFFVLCLFTALFDRLGSFKSHKDAMRVFDSAFDAYADGGTFQRAMAVQQRLRLAKALNWTKYAAVAFLLLGVVLAMVGAMKGWKQRSEAATLPVSAMPAISGNANSAIYMNSTGSSATTQPHP